MYKKFDLFFGFFVISVFLWFLYSIVSSSNIFSKSQIKLNATFSSAEGITEGSIVKVAGVKVGTVSSLKLDLKKFIATVELKLDSGLQIPSDSMALIKTSGILGSKFIDIEPGFEDDILQDGDEIIITKSAINLEEIINSFISKGIKK